MRAFNNMTEEEKRNYLLDLVDTDGEPIADEIPNKKTPMELIYYYTIEEPN